jgi:hypothetical protein
MKVTRMAVIIMPGSRFATLILVTPIIFKPIAKIMTPPVAVISNMKESINADGIIVLICLEKTARNPS